MRLPILSYWKPIVAGLALSLGGGSQAQDTFSIVAVDSVTGEVGSAGASCVDLDLAGIDDDTFIGQLLPGIGAINTQASYLAPNQDNAMSRLVLGDTPDQIIQYVITNDFTNNPESRQYGIAALIDGSPQTAAHTGTSTLAVAGQILGPNYAIQGNILLDQAVLDSMEARFLREPGSLACKLMAAMQGANRVGADSRCAPNGSSSLFAYVKVAQPTDNFGSPSFSVSLRTNNGDGLEPIDSLQVLFDNSQSCQATGLPAGVGLQERFSLFPNPAQDYLTIRAERNTPGQVQLIDALGRMVESRPIEGQAVLAVGEIPRGIYWLRLQQQDQVSVQRVVLR